MGKPSGLFCRSLLVLMAALNEEIGIGHTLLELKQYLRKPRFLVIDGNSADKTASVAKSLGAKVIYQKGRGKGKAGSRKRGG